MSDDSADTSWGFGTHVRGALLLEHAREALVDGDVEFAIAAAEEALDEDPDDADALMLIADAAPRMGFGELGVLAAEQARARGRDPGAVEAAALFGACQIETSLERANELIARDDGDARAWAVRGQALEILGLAGAEAALARANDLRPDLFPVSAVLSEQDWQRVWQAVLAKIDESRLQGITVRWRELPTLARLRESSPPTAPTVVLLLSPDRVCEVYRQNALRGSAAEEEIVEDLAAMLDAEIAFVLEA